MDEGLQWYRRRPRAFLDGVQGMGPELIGAYAVLIDLFYARGGVSLRDDRHLAGILGSSIRKARSLTDALIDLEKVVVRGNYLTNIVAEKEAKSSRTTREAQAKGGRDGAEKRWRPNENSGLPKGSPTNNPPLEKRREEKKSTPSPLDKDGDVDIEEFEEWYCFYPRKVAKGSARRAFVNARKKTDQADLVAAIKTYAAAVSGKDREFVAHPATWLNGERWLDSEVEPDDSSPVPIERLVAVAKDWLSRNDDIPTWMDNMETARALLKDGYDYDVLRRAGFSLPPRGNVVDIAQVTR